MSYVDQKERVISVLARTDSMASYGSVRHVDVVAWLLRLLPFASSWGTCQGSGLRKRVGSAKIKIVFN